MRFRLEPEGEWFKLVPVEDGPFPLRAHGFLTFDPKIYPDSCLMVEIKMEKVLVWIDPKGKKGA
jgi:hypothetical protein